VPVSKLPSLAVAVCAVGPTLVQVIVSPTWTVIVAGENLKSEIVSPGSPAACVPELDVTCRRTPPGPLFVADVVRVVVSELDVTLVVLLVVGLAVVVVVGTTVVVVLAAGVVDVVEVVVVAAAVAAGLDRVLACAEIVGTAAGNAAAASTAAMRIERGRMGILCQRTRASRQTFPDLVTTSVRCLHHRGQESKCRD
jgi:hypothetical protein